MPRFKTILVMVCLLGLTALTASAGEPMMMSVQVKKAEVRSAPSFLGAVILGKYKPWDNEKANTYINLLGQTLARASEMPETFGGYHFLIQDSDEINAFAAPGGLIFITRGMLRCCRHEDAVVGNMGSRNRFNYTMLGDAVNLAARLEGVNKQFGTYTIISRSTRDMLAGVFSARELARVAVVGRKEPVTVFEPMFLEEYEVRKDIFETFAQGLALFYEGDFSKASEIFSAIHDLDSAAAAYAEKCRFLAANRPEDWQGVWVMTSK